MMIESLNKFTAVKQGVFASALLAALAFGAPAMSQEGNPEAPVNSTPSDPNGPVNTNSPDPVAPEVTEPVVSVVRGEGGNRQQGNSPVRNYCDTGGGGSWACKNYKKR